MVVWRINVSRAELELSSLKQRLEESTAFSQALRLELQLSRHLARTTDDDKENGRGAVHRLVAVFYVVVSAGLAQFFGETGKPG